MVRAADDLEIVVDEADGAEAERREHAIQTYGLRRSAHSSVGISTDDTINRPPIVGVPPSRDAIRDLPGG
jgi:hypothetical protein